MSATVEKIVTYAAANVPAEWAELINKAMFAETLTSDTLRFIESIKPIRGAHTPAQVFTHGDVEQRMDLDRPGPIGSSVITIAASITIEKNGRKINIYVRYIPFSRTYTVRIAVMKLV